MICWCGYLSYHLIRSRNRLWITLWWHSRSRETRQTWCSANLFYATKSFCSLAVTKKDGPAVLFAACAKQGVEDVPHAKTDGQVVVLQLVTHMDRQFPASKDRWLNHTSGSVWQARGSQWHASKHEQLSHAFRRVYIHSRPGQAISRQQR